MNSYVERRIEENCFVKETWWTENKVRVICGRTVVCFPVIYRNQQLQVRPLLSMNIKKIEVDYKEDFAKRHICIS